MLMQLKRVAAELGLPFGERTMTYNSRRAQELGKWAEDCGKGDAFHNAVFRAYFAQGQNIAKQDVLVNVAESVDLSGEAALRIIEERTYTEAVDKDWSRSFRARVTAVPTFMINGDALVGAQSYKSLENFVVDRFE